MPQTNFTRNTQTSLIYGEVYGYCSTMNVAFSAIVFNTCYMFLGYDKPVVVCVCMSFESLLEYVLCVGKHYTLPI
jgi:hypothetical protein